MWTLFWYFFLSTSPELLSSSSIHEASLSSSGSRIIIGPYNLTSTLLLSYFITTLGTPLPMWTSTSLSIGSDTSVGPSPAPHPMWMSCLGSDILLWATVAYSTLHTVHTNASTPRLALPHLMALNCSHLEEKKRERKEDHELPLFLKKKIHRI